MGKIITFPVKRKLKINPKENSIVVGDCLEWLKFIPNNSIDLCAIDPPFFSNKTYEIIWGNGYERRCFEDRFKGGVKTYIAWMEERVREIHRVLKPTGSIFLHCDWRASHRLRVMLDDVFGEKDFVNEIIWCYAGGGISKKRLPKKHDTILWYSKTKNYFYEAPMRKYSPTGSGRHSDGSKYDKEKDRTPYNDWWNDLSPVNTMSKERIGYRTQKSEELYKRIIECSTKKGNLVLDCFAGGGTTAAVAAKLGRSFIAGDVSPVATRVIAQRLNNLTPPLGFP